MKIEKNKYQKLFLYLLLLAITSFAILIPFAPGLPTENLDSSWAFAMNYAASQNFSFGKDLIFTFGPYASIYTTQYHPATDFKMFYGSLFLATTFIIVMYSNVKNSTNIIKFISLLLIILMIKQRDVFFFYYCLLAGFYVFNNNEKNLQTQFYLILIFSGLGLIPLTKGTALLAALLTIIFSSIILIYKKNYKYSLIVFIVPLLSMILFWILAGQKLSGLPIYYKSMTDIISGYTDAMSLKGILKFIFLYALITFGLFCLFIFKKEKNLFFKISYALFVLALLFLAFKAGFVRNDGHAFIALNMLVMTSFAIYNIERNNKFLAIFVAALCLWFYADVSFYSFNKEQWKNSIVRPYLNLFTGLTDRVLDNSKYENFFNTNIEKIKNTNKIPLLEGSTDIYSYGQTTLIASGNTWNPRPVLQSYSAYTPTLININKQHLLSDKKPNNIIFNVETIDNRLPNLEDGASWPILLKNYELINSDQSYILLKNKININAIKQEKIFERSYEFKQEIFIPESDSFLFAKLEFKQTLLGKLINIIFKPTELEIKVRLQNGEIKSFRMISGMAKTDFLISELIEKNEEFKWLFLNRDKLNDKKIKSIMLEAPSGKLFWKNSFQMELTKVDKN